MTAIAAVRGHRIHLRPVLLLLALVAGLTFVLGAIESRPIDEQKAIAVAPPTDAIGPWLTTARAELFPGYAGPYIGTCPDGGPTVDGLCSRLVEDLGLRQIHLVGVVATDWGADLLLERVGTRWQVIDSATWPALGEPGHFGPPWSPQTAIAAWWHERAPEAVHLTSCADAAVVDTDQTVLCSTLAEATPTVRTYRSGPVDAPFVTLLLVELPDHTWEVWPASS